MKKHNSVPLQEFRLILEPTEEEAQIRMFLKVDIYLKSSRRNGITFLTLIRKT